MRIYLTFVHYCAIIDSVRNTQKRERYGADNENLTVEEQKMLCMLVQLTMKPSAFRKKAVQRLWFLATQKVMQSEAF